MFEADITKVVEEMSVRIRETQEDFILDTIFPYCQETLQKKINKVELKQIILRGSRPKGKWMECGGDEPWLKGYCCSLCNFTTTNKYNYCPDCGAEMGGADETN